MSDDKPTPFRDLPMSLADDSTRYWRTAMRAEAAAMYMAAWEMRLRSVDESQAAAACADAGKTDGAALHRGRRDAYQEAAGYLTEQAVLFETRAEES